VKGLLRRRPYDATTFDLLEESGRNAQRSAILLRDLVRDLPERPELADELRACERNGDRITHDVIHRLNGGSAHVPFEPSDGLALATAVDDVVDFAEQAADILVIYAVEAPMEPADALCEVLIGAAEQVAQALGCLRTGADMATHLVEIHRLENEGDRLSRAAVASLFDTGIDPMVVIRWKDIFGTLEAAVDACETVAHVLEGISLKRRRR
jgi:uncharacterized protein Yka (UPF0111/DUF47 family)